MYSNFWNSLAPKIDSGGVQYSVYAPNALDVSIEINDNLFSIDGPADKEGVWRYTDKNGKEGDRYIYIVNGVEKVDPVSRYNTPQPNAKSVVYRSTYDWTDESWLRTRNQLNFETKPLSIYEIHLGSWQKGKTYRDLADILPDYLRSLGYDAVQFMPIQDHFYEGSWGYLATGWFSPTTRYGTPDDLKHLIDRLHANKILVIFDWIPFHFAKDEMSLTQFDGTDMFEYRPEVYTLVEEWGSNVFNFTDPLVRDFLLSSLDFFITEYHFDGVRIDAISEIICLSFGLGTWDQIEYENLDSYIKNDTGGIEFIRSMTTLIKGRHSGVLAISEDARDFPGTTFSPEEDRLSWLGFDYKLVVPTMWGLFKEYFNTPSGNRESSVIKNSIHFSNEQKRIFQISHDDVVHGADGSVYSSLYVSDERLRHTLYTTILMFFTALPGKKLYFQGSEWGNANAWHGGNEYFKGFKSPDPSALIWEELTEDSNQKQILDFFKNLMDSYKKITDLSEDDFIRDQDLNYVLATPECGKDIVIFKRGDFLGVFNFSEETQNFDLSLDDYSLLLKNSNSDISSVRGAIAIPPASGHYFIKCKSI